MESNQSLWESKPKGNGKTVTSSVSGTWPNLHIAANTRNQLSRWPCILTCYRFYVECKNWAVWPQLLNFSSLQIQYMAQIASLDQFSASGDDEIVPSVFHSNSKIDVLWKLWEITDDSVQFLMHLVHKNWVYISTHLGHSIINTTKNKTKRWT